MRHNLGEATETAATAEAHKQRRDEEEEGAKKDNSNGGLVGSYCCRPVALAVSY
jgi:hypothetical protein